MTKPVASLSSSGHTTGTVMGSPVIVWVASVVAQFAGTFDFRHVPMDYDILPWRTVNYTRSLLLDQLDNVQCVCGFLYFHRHFVNARIM